MSTKTKFLIALQILISFILFMIAIFIFFTKNNALQSVQLLFTSLAFGVSSFVIFKHQYESIISTEKLKIFWIMGWVFSLTGIYLNVGIWSFGITLFIIAMVLSYRIKETN